MRATKYLLIALCLFISTSINYLAPLICLADMPSHVQEYENVYTISVSPSAPEEEVNSSIELGLEFLESLTYSLFKKILGIPFPTKILHSILNNISIVGPSSSAEIAVMANGQSVDLVGSGQFFLPIVYYSSGSYAIPPDLFNIWVQKKISGWNNWETIDYLKLFRDEINPLEAFVIPKNRLRIYDTGEYRVIVDDGVSKNFTITSSIPADYQISVAETTNGSISPCCGELVNRGNSITFNATPNTRYEVDQWKKNGIVDQNGGGYYTVVNVQEDMEISVTFKLIADNGDNIDTLLTASEDTYVATQYPTLTLGSQPTFGVQTDSNNDYYGLVKFNLDEIPDGSVVNNVELQLYCSNATGSQLNIREIDSSWAESSVKWNTKPTPGSNYSIWHSVSGVGFQHITDLALKNLVQGWLNGTENNYGIYLWGGDSGSSFSFTSSEGSNFSERPKLIVNYTPPSLPDLIVTSLSPDPSPLNNTFYVGDSISWDVIIKNNGGGPAGLSEVGYYIGNSPNDLSTPLTPDSADNINALNVGETDSANSVYVFTNSDIGQRYLICIADNKPEVDEIQEGNNKRVYGPINIAIKKVSTPIISPIGSTFISPTQVTLFCSTQEATIRYTTDGSTPTSSSTIYSNPFMINSSSTVNVRGFKSDYIDSDIASASFIINPVIQRLPAPTDLWASDGSDGQSIHLIWNTVPGADGYRMYRSETTNSSTALLINPNIYGWISDMEGNVIQWQAFDYSATTGIIHKYWVCAVSINDAVATEGYWAGPESGHLLSADTYEPDNQIELAKAIPIDGTQQIHNLNASSDVDWIKFDISQTAGVNIILDYGNVHSGFRFELYGPDNSTMQIAYNQNWLYSKESLNISRINENALIPGRYYIKCRTMDNYFHDPGQYALSINLLPNAPSIIGLSQADAESVITSAALVVGTITKAYSETEPAGYVISQNPVGGISVAVGSAVDIVISKARLSDAIAILQVLSGQNLGQNKMPSYDVNGDSLLGLEEVLYILQEVAEIR